MVFIASIFLFNIQLLIFNHIVLIFNDIRSNQKIIFILIISLDDYVFRIQNIKTFCSKFLFSFFNLGYTNEACFNFFMNINKLMSTSIYSKGNFRLTLFLIMDVIEYAFINMFFSIDDKTSLPILSNCFNALIQNAFFKNSTSN